MVAVSPQAVTGWIENGMPCRRGKGRGNPVEVDIAVALPWVMSRREPQGSQRERLAKEQADKIALENAVKRGELIHTSHVADVMSSLGADLAARHDAGPGRLAGELAGLSDPAVIRQRLLDEFRGIRGAFSDAIAKLADAIGTPADDGGDSEPAPEADGKRVGRSKPRPAARKRRARAVEK